jgi:hypothetical protein
MTAPTNKAPTDLQQLSKRVEEIEREAMNMLMRVTSCIATIRAAAADLDETSLDNEGPANCPEIVIQAVGSEAGKYSDLLWEVIQRLSGITKELAAATSGARNASFGGA